MPESNPVRKFLHPLPVWHAVLIFLVAQLVATFALVALREGFGVRIPDWVAGAAGGLFGVVGVQIFARRRLAKAADPRG